MKFYVLKQPKKYASSDNIILIHDPSEIRKKHTKQAEHIERVKDLSKKTANGYSSFNTVAVNVDNIVNTRKI